jgi:hypothetical protein
MSTVVIAATSDQHAGSALAMCPAEIKLDDGGTYTASKMQRWAYQCWGDYWKRVAQVVKKEKALLYEVFHGDAVEGQHHGSTQVASGNPNAQAAIITACMAIPLALKPDKMFWVRGTETHVGQSASAEERIADGLRRDKRPVIGDPIRGWRAGGTSAWK